MTKLKKYARLLAGLLPQLIYFFQRLAYLLGLFRAVLDNLTTQGNASQTATVEEYEEFLLEVFQATLNSRGSMQEVYPLLYANLDKLDVNLAKVLSHWARVTLPTVNAQQQQVILATINDFSILIQEFPLGNPSSNWEIAIAGYKVRAAFLTREDSPENWARTQNDLGSAYSGRIRGNRADNLEAALTAYKAALQVYTQDMFPEEWATVQNNLGTAYNDRIQGDRTQNLENAIAAYQSALQVYTPEIFPQDWGMVQINLGIVYSNCILGNQSENLKRAIAAFETALQVYTKEKFPQQWAIIKANLGNTYLYLHAYEVALQVYKQQEFPEQWRLIQSNLARSYRSRICGEKLENLEQAICCYNSALQIYTRENFPQDWATLQNNLGNAYMNRIGSDRSKHLEQAVYCYKAALQIRKREDTPEQWATTQNNLAAAYRDQEQTDKAIECFRSALKVFTYAAFPAECLTTGQNLGDTAFAAGHWLEAIEGYRIAIDAVEQTRVWAKTDHRRQEVLSDAMEIYVNMVQICINTQQFERAFEYVERSKSRNLVDTLANRDIYPKGNISKNVINNLQQLRREIVAEQRRLDIVEQNRSSSLISSISQPLVSSAAWLSEHNRLNELLKQLNDLITNEIDPIDPSFKLTQQVKPISFNEIVGQNSNKILLDEGTAMLEWYITHDRFHLFIIIAQSNHLKVWSSSTEEKGELEELNSWFNEYLQDYQCNREQWVDKLSERLYCLSKILHIDEIVNSLPANCDQLILIPHRFLHLIPLHALPLSRQRCLLDRFPKGVRYAPSCQLLQLTQNQECYTFNRLLALQNPTQDLGYTSVEVGMIQHYFSQADVFVEKAATKATLVEVKIKDNGTREVIQNSQLSLANCVHFSCHGEFNFESPLESALLLADGERLTLGEIFDFNLSQCRLVTLSACETGLTNYKILSDEYVGIPSSFLYAGTPSIVSSLWTVQDVSTAFLMIKFYQNISVYKKVAVALNQAQLWLRNLTKKELQEWISENKISLDATLSMKLRRILHKISDDEQPFKLPFYWAAFCAIGQ